MSIRSSDRLYKITEGKAGSGAADLVPWDSFPWYEDRVELSDLWAFLVATDREPVDGVVYFLTKPWKWDTEYEEMRRSGPAEGEV